MCIFVPGGHLNAGMPAPTSRAAGSVWPDISIFCWYRYLFIYIVVRSDVLDGVE